MPEASHAEPTPGDTESPSGGPQGTQPVVVHGRHRGLAWTEVTWHLACRLGLQLQQRDAGAGVVVVGTTCPPLQGRVIDGSRPAFRPAPSCSFARDEACMHLCPLLPVVLYCLYPPRGPTAPHHGCAPVLPLFKAKACCRRLWMRCTAASAAPHGIAHLLVDHSMLSQDFPAFIFSRL